MNSNRAAWRRLVRPELWAVVVVLILGTIRVLAQERPGEVDRLTEELRKLRQEAAAQAEENKRLRAIFAEEKERQFRLEAEKLKSEERDQLQRRIEDMRLQCDRDLEVLFKDCGFATWTVVGKPADETTLPQFENQAPGSRQVLFTVKGTATYHSLMKMFEEFHKEKKPQYIREFMLSRPAKSPPERDPKLLDVSMTIKFVFLIATPQAPEERRNKQEDEEKNEDPKPVPGGADKKAVDEQRRIAEENRREAQAARDELEAARQWAEEREKAHRAALDQITSLLAEINSYKNNAKAAAFDEKNAPKQEARDKAAA